MNGTARAGHETHAHVNNAEECLLCPLPDFSYVFWVATQRELENPRPDGFQAPYIHFFRLANICLTCLNGFWFSKMARGALQLLTKGRAGDAGGSRTAAADINVVAVNGKAVNSKLD